MKTRTHTQKTKACKNENSIFNSIFGRRHILKIILFCFILFNYFQENGFSQTLPCCEDSEIIQQISTVNAAIPGGYVTITYEKYRCKDSNPLVEFIKIISIQASSSLTQSFSAEEIHENTIFAILKDNLFSMAPPIEGQGNMWYLYEPACWYLDGVSYSLQACYNSPCCNISVFEFHSDCGTSFEAITNEQPSCAQGGSGNPNCFFVCGRKLRAGSTNSQFPFTN